MAFIHKEKSISDKMHDLNNEMHKKKAQNILESFLTLPLGDNLDFISERRCDKNYFHVIFITAVSPLAKLRCRASCTTANAEFIRRCNKNAENR